MSDSFEERRKALEDQFFAKQNEEALKKLKEKKERIRPSPITGKPMKQIEFMGVTIDQCEDSKGVWLDAGELEQIIKNASKKSGSDNANEKSYLQNLFESLLKR
ncbi:MAG TPA: zf-TFIIB domain-containing protein [Oligoflexia bacterium]|nr:zf-TFIIB domain-containing protein [Oligoflexia bacterium]HMP27166.1 zf-TFIIB domain-containing protein [Oligoflexia bacterium]